MTRVIPLKILASVLGLVLATGPALARAADKGPRGTLAVVNAGKGGHEVVERVARSLGPHLGGWTRQPGVDAFLAGRPSPGALPVGKTGEDLVRLVEKLREDRSPSRSALTELGRLLGVDYLLLVRVGARSVVARLYSVHRQAYAPESFEGQVGEEGRLRDYVLAQTRGPSRPAGRRWSHWWIWAAAAGLAALTIGLAVSSGGDDATGDLRIRVTR